MKKILTFYLCILLIITTYQDFFLVNKLGEIFRTTIPFLLPIFLIVEIINIANKKKLFVTKIQKYFVQFFISIVAVSFLYVFYFYLMGNYNFYKDNYLSKAFKGFTYLLLIVLYMRHLYSIFLKLDYKSICFSFIVAISFLNVILLIEFFTMPHALLFLHSDHRVYNRIRLLTAESSWTGTIYVVYCSITLYLSKILNRKIFFVYAITSFILYSLVSGSKGFIVAGMISLIPFLFKKGNIKTFFYGLILVSFVGIGWTFYFSKVLFVNLSSDVQSYTSVSTRIGLILVAIKIFLYNPFGVGTGVFIYYLGEKIPEVFPWLNSVFYFLFSSIPNKSELLGLTQNSTNLAVKSGIFQWLLIGGVFSIYFFVRTYKYIRSRVKSVILIYCLYYIVLAELIYTGLDIKYEIWLYVAFVEATVLKNNSDKVI